MTQPISPATIATMVPARNAFTMKWNSNICRTSRARSHDKPEPLSVMAMRVDASIQVRVIGRGFGLSDHDETSIRGVQHLDRRPVQPAQRRARNALGRSTGNRAAAGDVDDPINVRQDRV